MRSRIDKLDGVTRMNAPWQACLWAAGVVSTLNRYFGRLMIWPIFAAVLVSAGNAISRKVFDLSSNAMLELQWYLFGLSFLGAAGYVLLVDEHVRIDAVAQRAPPRLRAWLDISVLSLFVVPLCAWVGWLGADLALEAWRNGEMSGNASGLPRWPAYACIPLGLGLLGLQALAEVVRRAAWLGGHVEQAALKEADLPPLSTPADSPPAR